MTFPDAENSLGILWRGPLDSCNYGCSYCPFAKRAPRRTVLRADEEALARFVDWVKTANAWRLQLLFTPYGEALIWPWYREALVELSHVPHVQQVSIQTNGSGPMTFFERADRSRVSLWVTFHPSEIVRAEFVARISALHAAGTSLSVGMVVSPERIAEAQSLRRELPQEVPLWLNAQKPGVRFTATECESLREIDPSFDLETQRHRTRGKLCRTGEDVISVDGRGNIRRCHFIDEVIGNLYRDELQGVLRPRLCTRATCECWIGYAHLDELGVRDAYPAASFLSRVRHTSIDMPDDRRHTLRILGATHHRL